MEKKLDEKRVKHLIKELNFFLNNAPVEDDCTNEENDLYSDMANVINDFANLGYY